MQVILLPRVREAWAEPATFCMTGAEGISEELAAMSTTADVPPAALLLPLLLLFFGCGLPSERMHQSKSTEKRA